jgi:uncharacterized protein (TIGR03382 family)
MKNRTRIAIALAALAGGISAANADIIITASYLDLRGDYVQSAPGVGMFTAVANDANPIRSTGDVARVDGNPGTAGFETGFVSGLNPADFSISLSVSVLIPGQIATGSGTFTITDADGDTLTGNVDGAWIYDTVEGFIYFNGALSNVFANDNGQQDGLFNGTELGSWSLAGLGTQPFDGAISQIVLPAGGFFTGSFSNAATGLTAQIIPAPGALALLGLGGLVGGRRRR